MTRCNGKNVPTATASGSSYLTPRVDYEDSLSGSGASAQRSTLTLESYGETTIAGSETGQIGGSIRKRIMSKMDKRYFLGGQRIRIDVTLVWNRTNGRTLDSGIGWPT